MSNLVATEVATETVWTYLEGEGAAIRRCVIETVSNARSVALELPVERRAVLALCAHRAEMPFGEELLGSVDWCAIAKRVLAADTPADTSIQ